MLRSLFLIIILFVSISFSANAQAYVVENTIGFKAGKGNTATESYHYTSEGVYHTFIFAVDDKARSFYKWSDIKSIKAFEDHVKIYGDCLINGKMYYNQFAKIYIEDEFIGPSVVMAFRRLKAFYTGEEDPLKEIEAAREKALASYKEPTAEEKARWAKEKADYYNKFSIVDDTWPINITVEELKKKQPVTSSWELKFDNLANLQLLQPKEITFNEFSKKQFEGEYSQYKDLPVHAAIIKNNKVVGYQTILYFDSTDNYGYTLNKEEPSDFARNLDFYFGFEKTEKVLKTSKYTYIKSSWNKESKKVEWDRTAFVKKKDGRWRSYIIHVHRVMYE